MKTLNEWTVDELLSLPNREYEDINIYNSLLILPKYEPHDSGWGCIIIIGVVKNEPKEINKRKKYPGIGIDIGAKVFITLSTGKTYPNIYWVYPLYVYLHKYGKFNNEEFSIEKEVEIEFISLLKNLTKYLFIKGVVHNSVNSVNFILLP